MNVEQIMDDEQGLQLTEENIELVLDEIRPYLVGESPEPHGKFLPALIASALLH